MLLRPPESTLTSTLFPVASLFRCDRLELGLVVLAPARFVRVQIDREAAIGGLDRPRIRSARAAEQFVIIDLGGHAAPASFSTSPLRKRGSIFLPSQDRKSTRLNSSH